MSFNSDKTELVVLIRRKKLPSFSEPQVFRVVLRRSMSFNYLGVALNSRLTWREHADVKVRKDHRLLWACRRACGVTWDLSPNVVH